MNEAAAARRRHLARELACYWSPGEQAVLALPVPWAPAVADEPLPPELVIVALPEWARDLGVDGGLLVPRSSTGCDGVADWRGVDWWHAAFWHANGLAERAHERRHGPIHSYSVRLAGWDARLWRHAWVNRIALFLRRWSARAAGCDEEAIAGRLPEPDIRLTHDVDAVDKTLAIRCKQTAFHLFNALRQAARGRPAPAWQKLRSALRFLVSTPGYRHFDAIAAAEAAIGRRSCFFVYGGPTRRRGAKAALFDPGYDVGATETAAVLRDLARRGWQIGLHPSFDAWCDAERLRAEKARVEQALGSEIASCRQHWLRFAWDRTWQAQERAGFEVDATLGFNDRPGFRNGAALRLHPWDPAGERPMRIASLPMVLMDSHLYDYAALDQEARTREMRRWLDEVSAVRGCATVIWHTHVLAADYGWKAGFDTLLSLLATSSPTGVRT